MIILKLLRQCYKVAYPQNHILIMSAHSNKFNNVSKNRSACNIVHKMNETIKLSDVEASFLNLFSP